jgi:glycosyltransferase involved in cell wall biosynthesis
LKEQNEVFLIGINEGEHPGGSRFTDFHHHLNSRFVPSALPFRFMASRWGQWVDWQFRHLSRRPNYAFGLLVQEISAAFHMLVHRGAVYHSMKGEVDLHWLPRLSRMVGGNLVATFHDDPPKLAKRLIDARFVRELAGVVVLCHEQRRYFEDLMPAERVFHVPHGVDTEFFHPASTLSQEPVVVAVGSYNRDFESLGRAMSLVWASAPAVRFLLVGTRQADDWNPPPRIDDPRLTYVDGVSDSELCSIYHGAAAAIVSVHQATANNALLEGMACGLPVVATDVGGIREYLGESAGVLCPTADPRALADGVLRVLGDRQFAVRMGAEARNRALRFDYRVVAEELRQVYERVRSLDVPVSVGLAEPA